MFIGPINYNAKNFPEERKIKLTARFLVETGQDKETLYVKIKAKISDLKMYFKLNEECECFDGILALILFFDRCSVLQFMYSYVVGKLECFEINHRVASLIQQDSFLLENQLPFEVLNVLMEGAKTKRKSLESSISAFIRPNIMAPVNYST